MVGRIPEGEPKGRRLSAPGARRQRDSHRAFGIGAAAPPSPPRLFLGVERSVTGQRWRDRLDPTGQARALTMVQQLGLSDILARVMAARDVGVETAAAWLDPTVRALMPDPERLTDMPAAVTRLAAAIDAGETVAIFGDYDVDGAASAALLGGFLQRTGTPFRVHIPNRVTEGYGPNIEGVRALAAAGCTLLVAVDCGTSSHEPIAEAGRLGLDTIVLDHHQAPEALPHALAIVNPNRHDDLSGLRDLCAAGVVFMTIVALNRLLRRRGFWTQARPEPDLLEMLDLVALATVADVVPLVGLNRAFVTKGLAVMHARGRPGLRALFDVAGAAGPPRPYHLGFLLGPRINAGGRIGDAALGSRLLLESDDIQAQAIAARLDALNRERRTIEQSVLAVAEAEAMAALGLDARGQVIVAVGTGWHPGVVGIVAARLKERFRLPAFVVAMSGDVGTGSGRSIPGVDLGRAIRAAVDSGILIKGGGHAMAAGLTIAAARLGDFRTFLEESLAPAVAEARASDGLGIDAALVAAAATPALVTELERAGPYGSGNTEPVFVFPSHRILDARTVGESHVRVVATAGDGAKIDAIAFRAAETPLGLGLLKAKGECLHLAGNLSVDRYGGATKVQLRLLDAAEPKGRGCG